MTYKSLLYITLVLLLQNALQAQDDSSKIFESLNGCWQGAFIKNNSYQKFDIQFLKKDDEMLSLQIIEEWHPQFGEFLLPIEIDSLGNIKFNTGHGKAIMRLDQKSLELTGALENTIPLIYVHLKKVPNPPAKTYTTEAVTIKNGEIELFGHLHKPMAESKTAMILVGGRGCYAGSTKYDLYAKLLRSYGISVLVFNKRGTGKSNGDCNTATITDLASDVIACKKYLEKHNNKFDNIGILGSSAGGWVMNKAQEDGADFDFMIAVVGPSTSVKDQQLQSMKYGLDFYKLSDEAKKSITEYTSLMFDAKPTVDNYDRFKILLDKSKNEGWNELLDDTDVPSSYQAIDSLWVRRHNYDPKNVLQNFNNPYLAIFGEIDWIVPYKENVKTLKDYFSNGRQNLLEVMVAYDAEHGTETKGKYVTLEGNTSYWRFFRISPSVQITIIDFLTKHNLISKNE
ncbi:MAG: alpha/beta hydrolase [Winogradskyella sp.]|uniref:alpha/beta hydrolase family protein n=1 Tax=Winogradskyella sp. TaxID=1883156 RepID=UPI000F3C0E9F|nr:alpha/beta hydrolase [Winogradskyella sp.]RNC86382.1 MAG: alpha/beta hydrolase [Winogradskyella sp.]